MEQDRPSFDSNRSEAVGMLYGAEIDDITVLFKKGADGKFVPCTAVMLGCGGSIKSKIEKLGGIQAFLVRLNETIETNNG